MKSLVIIVLILGMISLPIKYNHSSPVLKSHPGSQGLNELKTTVEPGFTFEALPYAYDALEPYIDKQTVEIHYSKHHKAYYDKFMEAIRGTAMENMTMPEIFKSISKYPMAVRNNGGGYYNHNFYWQGMKPKGGGMPSGKLLPAIEKAFGTFNDFKMKFTDAGKTLFGSGWVWLCCDQQGGVFICTSPNQDNPLMDIADKKGIPLLNMDVWEHAYYLKYQNRRADYIDAFWNLIAWDMAEKRYEEAMK